MTEIGQVISAMRALAADLVTERERARSLLRENRELTELVEAMRLDQLETQQEAGVCPHCGLPLQAVPAGRLEPGRHNLCA